MICPGWGYFNHSLRLKIQSGRVTEQLDDFMLDQAAALQGEDLAHACNILHSFAAHRNPGARIGAAEVEGPTSGAVRAPPEMAEKPIRIH